MNLNNCQADTSVSADGAQKFRDRVDKAKEEVNKTRQGYEKYLNELSQYRYDRLRYFKIVLLGLLTWKVCPLFLTSVNRMSSKEASSS